MSQVLGAPGAQLVILSGPSGVGKDTIIEEMQKRTPARPRHYVVTVTTRERRENEVHGVHYLFLTLDDYERLRAQDGLLEASDVHGNWYGTPADQVRTAVSSGRDAILKIDVQGAAKVQARVPDALLVFIVPPSREELVKRLKERRTETPEALARRIEDATYELSRRDEYDHVVVNETGRIEKTAEEIDAIIAEQHARFPERRIRV